MRYKAVPTPRAAGERPADAADGVDAGDRTGSLDDLATVRDALPRVPRPESDCCARIERRVDWIADRETAREWLVFLRALGLADRSSGGEYLRADAEVDRDPIAERFRENVLGASAVLDALAGAADAADSPNGAADAADAPLGIDAAFAAVEPEIPEWERRRTDDWEAVWREHVRDLLAWWVRLRKARRIDDGYVRV